MLAGSAADAIAATYTVTTTADTMVADGACTPSACSLRQAVTAAGDGDTVELPASTNPYTLVNGQLTVSASILIEGAGAGSSVIKADDGDRVMLISGNTGAVRLRNLTITGGDTTRAGGGGIAAAGPGPLVLNGVAVTGNMVAPSLDGFNEGGGGIFSIPALTVINSQITGNTATVTQSDGDGGGGGIMVTTGALTVTNSTISHNSTTVTPTTPASPGTDNNGGGGLYFDGTSDLTITGSLIQDNTATITDATTTGTPADGGGGIYQFGTNLRLSGSTVAGNVAHAPGLAKSGGGGVFDDGDMSQYVNSTITGNSTDVVPATSSGFDNSDGGGGIQLDNVKGGVTIANVTITANTASASVGGGINNNLVSSLDVTNSIVAGNSAGVDGGNCDGPLRSDGDNLSDDSAAANSCSLTATGDLVGINPLLGALSDNGGPTPTQALLPGSPAIDAGDPAGCTDLLGTPLGADQRGVPRPEPAGGRCDIGAYEQALPTAITGAAAVSPPSVTLSGSAANLDPRDGTVTFQYGPTATYGQSTAAQPLTGASTTETVTAAVAGLSPGIYHDRVVATTPAGSAAGADGTFQVPAVGALPAPAATTQMATHVGPFRAILYGFANPQGQATAVHFEYGTTESLTSRTASASIGTGGSSSSVSAVIGGLLPGTLYHFRLVAQNASGVTDGAVVTFRASRRPTPRRLSAIVNPRADVTAPFVFALSGRLRLPGGLPGSVGCRGTVLVTATAHARRVGRARASIEPSCRYHVTIRLAGRRLGSRGRARLTVRFAGDAVAGRQTRCAARGRLRSALDGQVGVDLGQCLSEIHAGHPAPAVGAVGEQPSRPRRPVLPHRIDPESASDGLEIVTLRGASGSDVESDARAGDRPARRVGRVRHLAAGEVSGQRREVGDVHPREGLVRARAAGPLVVAHRRRAQRVPHRGRARPEDGRRTEKHPRDAVDAPKGQVGVALGHGIVVGIVGDQVRRLVDVSDPRRAVIDRRGRDVDQPLDARGGGRASQDGRPLDGDAVLGRAVAAHRVHRGDHRGCAGHHSGGKVGLCEVADNLREPREIRRRAAAPDDCPHTHPSPGQCLADPRSDEPVRSGDHDGGCR